jgi:hypothetical protein
MSYLDRYPESMHARVASDLASRLHAGINEYGVPLVAHNGRDALWDAYEECLDMACYLRQAIDERE